LGDALPPGAAAWIAAIVGLLVGSFLGTLVLRLPKRMPVVAGRSACPHCGHVLGPLELIPLVSWVVQRRRCRACGHALSAFYPAMEIAAAAVAGGIAMLVPWPLLVPAILGGWALLVPAAWAIRRICESRLRRVRS
jgi:leader peptidase (prepilin peptidase)/N-methyltransferase